MSPDYVPSRDYLGTAWRTYAAQRFGDVPPLGEHFVDFIQELVAAMTDPEPETDVVYEYVEAGANDVEELLHDLDNAGKRDSRAALVHAWLRDIQR